MVNVMAENKEVIVKIYRSETVEDLRVLDMGYSLSPVYKLIPMGRTMITAPLYIGANASWSFTPFGIFSSLRGE